MSKSTQFIEIMDACEAFLSSMQQYVMSRQWEKFVSAEHGYSLAMNQFQTLCETNTDQLKKLEGSTDRLRNLSQQHRRVMRLVNSHMQVISDDIKDLEQGSRRFRQLASEFVEN